MKKSKKLFISLLIVALIIATLLGFKACANKKEEIIREPVIQEPVAQDSTLEQGTTVQEPVVEVVEEKKEEKVVDKTTLSYWVNFLNKDGSVLQRTVYEYGSTPSYKGETPTYNDYAYYYSFKGWDKAISTVTGTQTYTAQYDITGEVSHKSSNTTMPEPNYLKFTNVDNISVTITPNFLSGEWYYLKDGSSEWIKGSNYEYIFSGDFAIKAGDTPTSIVLDPNESVLLNGTDCTTGLYMPFPTVPLLNKRINFCISGKVSVSGDVTSLTNGIGGDAELSNYCYSYMFFDSPITTAPNLPSKEMAEGCYEFMFAECAYLTSAPELSSIILANNCYERMFYNCDALTTAPNLPATNLSDGCYMHMFNDCSNLVTAPALNATMLKSKCYYGMFTGCKLTSAPKLPAITLADDCYYQMFYNCGSLKVSNTGTESTLIFDCPSGASSSDIAEMFTGTVGVWPGAGNSGTPTAGSSYYWYN